MQQPYPPYQQQPYRPCQQPPNQPIMLPPPKHKSSSLVAQVVIRIIIVAVGLFVLGYLAHYLLMAIGVLAGLALITCPLWLPIAIIALVSKSNKTSETIPYQEVVPNSQSITYNTYNVYNQCIIQQNIYYQLQGERWVPVPSQTLIEDYEDEEDEDEDYEDEDEDE